MSSLDLLKKTKSSSIPPLQSTRLPSVNTPIAGRATEMTSGDGGGYKFLLTQDAKIDRFLILGSMGCSIKVGQQVSQATEEMKQIARTNGVTLVSKAIAISQAGRAKDNNFALMALALGASYGNSSVKEMVKVGLPLVARTGTHLLNFVSFVNAERGWGRSLKKTVANWYDLKTADQVAYQVVKYQQRDGWSHKDVFRLVHPKTDDTAKSLTYRWVMKGADKDTQPGGQYFSKVPSIISAFEEAKEAPTERVLDLIKEYNLSMEMLPTELKNRADIWEALLPRMGSTALIRNLNKLSSLGLAIGNSSSAEKLITSKLLNVELLKKDRVHPMSLFIAKKVYDTGGGFGAAALGVKTKLEWKVSKHVSEALEQAFYLAFATIEPSGKNIMLGLDVSGSMSSHVCSGSNIRLTAREASAIMAMATARCEPGSRMMAFSSTFMPLNISREDNFAKVLQKISGLPFAHTDMSLPMLTALKNSWDVDSFVIYTDNEINAGTHPSAALLEYRRKTGKKEARLISVAMSLTNFSIADPKDAGMLDIAGFDSEAPKIISDFTAGRI